MDTTFSNPPLNLRSARAMASSTDDAIFTNNVVNVMVLVEVDLKGAVQPHTF